jgi:hypothetical protein
MVRGEKGNAIRLLRTVVKQDSDHVDAYLQLGNIMREENPQQAVKIHQSLTVRPGLLEQFRIELHKALALDYNQAGNQNLAKREAEQLLRVDRRNLWALEFLLDPEIDDKASSGGARGKGKIVSLKNSGSLCRMQTCNPKAKIESKTYHFAVVDEAQGADEFVIAKSIKPMLAFNNGTIALTGTATRTKSYFYRMIQFNKRRDINRKRGQRTSHFEYDWTVAAKYNENYGKFIRKEKVRIGEDSDEFRMSYLNHWMLEKGMFVTEERLDRLYDTSMQLVPEWWRTPIVIGIDVARSNDSTVATAVWVDWDHPDGLGFFEHRVLNWLEIHDTDWESQYFKIVDFVRNYDVLRVGIDAQGVGGAVAERLALLLPDIEVLGLSSDAKAQNERWVHLTELIQRDQLVIPGHSKAKRTRRWKKFNQQMVDLERINRGPYLLAEAPEERGAFDDYPDSLALACCLTVHDVMPTVSVAENPFFV